MATLAEINTLLGPTVAADLTQIIANVKAAVTTSYDGIVAEKEKERDAAIAKCEAIARKIQDPNATKEDAQLELEKEANARELEELTKARDAKAQEVADIEAKIQELGK